MAACCSCRLLLCVSFFFSSRRRHTRLQGDWSSDVCSSDLDSCSAATVQMARAEADPVYAWKLHNEDVHSRDLNSFIGEQQAELMVDVGGTPEIGRASCRERV